MSGIKEVCDGCGNSTDTENIKECPFCGLTKCNICDAGNNTECLNCKERDEI